MVGIYISFEDKSAMNTLFGSCLGERIEEHPDLLSVIRPQPLKFRIADSLHLIDLLLRNFAQPRKLQKYTFQRNNLHFLRTERSHIPLLYFPAAFPSISLLVVYSHGSGSTLNNVYDYAYTLAIKYGVGVIAYDYSGDGESEISFGSYQEDLKLVLAWAVRQGYKLPRTILCGFSLGSYSALCLQGEMPRILISPICGIISFFESQAARYQNERYDNISKALKLHCRALVTHCSEELVHISHGKLIAEALKRDLEGNIGVVFHEITDKNFSHRSAPSFLCSGDGEQLVKNFLAAVNIATRKQELKDEKTIELLRELEQIQFTSISDSEENKMEMTTNI